MARVACILAADFPVAAMVRATPSLRDRPLALATSREGHGELTSVSAGARESGLRPGMTVAQARVLAPILIVATPSAAAQRSAHDAILDAAESFSPIVEDGGPGCVYVDLAGLTAIHGTEDEMGAELSRRAAMVGIEAAIGIASGKEVAYLAAKCGGKRVIPAEKEREFLDWLPLDVLSLGATAAADGRDGEDLELTLARWGIRRLGELARIDARALGSRLGARGVELARLARGEQRAPFVARPRRDWFAESIELEYGIETIEPLGFVMRPMIERLAARLELRGLIGGDIALSLGLCGHRSDDRRIVVAAATIEARSLLALMLLSLEASPPAAAIETILITIEARRPRPAQADLFLPPSPAPDRLQTTIARLSALCGPDRVGALKPADSWRLDALEVTAFDPPAQTVSIGRLKGNGSEQRIVAEDVNVARLVVRAIRPAQEIEVMCTRGGVPEFVRGTTVCARVVSISGPWRRQGEWWLDDLTHRLASPLARPLARDYYDVALADGGVYRMFCELRSQQWFVDGLYD